MRLARLIAAHRPPFLFLRNSLSTCFIHADFSFAIYLAASKKETEECTNPIENGCYEDERARSIPTLSTKYRQANVCPGYTNRLVRVSGESCNSLYMRSKAACLNVFETR